MKKTLTALALASCVATPLFAQSFVKQDIITLALNGVKQSSVSTSPTVANAGLWSARPKYYKSAIVKVTDQDVIKYIGLVMWGNANHYTSKARLVLVQGELSGFFNITANLAGGGAGGTTANLVAGNPDGTFTSDDADASTALSYSSDSTFLALANGRHWDVNPIDPGAYPVGHLQPWGQIYVKDQNGIADNVTFFFAISVEECYDCFYMNSFVSDAKFTIQNVAQSGPPCCSLPYAIVGSGKDRYYMTISFDNTLNNPYLNPIAPNYVGNWVGTATLIGGAPVVGVGSTTIPGDGIVPDTILGPGGLYVDAIRSGVGAPSPYEARFTLHGVMAYTWNLKFVDRSDLAPDFVGKGAFSGSGYGFVGLYCTVFNCGSTVTFTESVVRAGTAVMGEPWVNSWFGIGAEYSPGTTTTMYDVFVAAAAPYVWGSATTGAAFGYPTPINVSASLSYHKNFNTVYPNNAAKASQPAAWPSPAYIPQP